MGSRDAMGMNARCPHEWDPEEYGVGESASNELQELRCSAAEVELGVKLCFITCSN